MNKILTALSQEQPLHDHKQMGVFQAPRASHTSDVIWYGRCVLPGSYLWSLLNAAQQQ